MKRKAEQAMLGLLRHMEMLCCNYDFASSAVDRLVKRIGLCVPIGILRIVLVAWQQAVVRQIIAERSRYFFAPK